MPDRQPCLFEVWIPGVPVADQEPRARVVHVTGKPSFVQIYKPKAVRSYRDKVAKAARAAHTGRKTLDGPLLYCLDIYLERPKSRPRCDVYADKKPDLDNLEKPINDGLEKAGVIRNDSRIVGKRVRKHYAYGVPPGIRARLYQAPFATPWELTVEQRKIACGARPGLDRAGIPASLEGDAQASTSAETPSRAPFSAEISTTGNKG